MIAVIFLCTHALMEMLTSNNTTSLQVYLCSKIQILHTTGAHISRLSSFAVLPIQKQIDA